MRRCRKMTEEDKKYAFITEAEGFVYCATDNGESIGYSVENDGSYVVPHVNC
jgi:hypothetical protein